MIKPATHIAFCAYLLIAGLLTGSCNRKAPTAAETEDCLAAHLLMPSERSRIALKIGAKEKGYRLDSLFQKKARYQGFNGAVLVARQGVILYSNAFGYADARKKTPLTADHRFQLASVSKTFTGVATLLLVQEGKISMQDSVQQYITDFPYHGIRIIDLLSHRSGLPNYVYAFEDKRRLNTSIPNNDSILKWFAAADPPIPPYNLPGRNFSYNNTNFALLAAIIEKVSGQSFASFMKENIFDPLGMKSSSVDTLCPGSLLNTTGHQNGRARTRDFYDGVYGDKGIYSTVNDMFRWYVAIRNNCLLNRHWTREAFTPRSMEKRSRHNYGLGFRLMTDPGNMKQVRTIYHGGWWAGYTSMFWYDPEEDYVIIILSNRKSNSTYEIRPILRILEGDPEEDGSEGETDSI